MTNRDSDALCLPARPPQHAAPVSFLRRRESPGQLGVFGRLRELTRQMLHLFITSVAWAAGLALVIGSVVLVATVTAPTHDAPPLKILRDAGGTPLHPIQYGTRKAAANHRSYQVLAAFSGHGSRWTAQFDVNAKLPWQLQWTYRCAAHADAGQFMLQRADLGGPGQAAISTTTEDFAASGHGSMWLKPTSQRHYLVVMSACSWHVKVEQAA